MAQRPRNDSAADAVLNLSAKLPWWAGVTLALVMYLWLHHVANQAPPAPLTAPVQPGQMGQLIAQQVGPQLTRAVASIGQYVLPGLILLGAAVSAWRSRLSRRALQTITEAQDASQAIAGLSWRDFERMVGEAFRRRGFLVIERGGSGPDGGIDLVLRRMGGDKYLVQCKHWRAHRVGVEIVREQLGLVTAHGAAGSFVVTSGRFTEEAQRFAQGRQIDLIDGARLKRMLDQVKTADATAPAPAGAQKTTRNAPASPACPTCGKAMVKRMAKRGDRAGQMFWGCEGYPVCRGTKTFDA